MDHELGKKMSALRLGEANRTSAITRPTPGMQYQPASSSQIPPYNYSNTVSEVKYGTTSEGIYANLEELTGAHVRVRYQDTFIPPPEQFSQRLVQISHVPTQSKVGLEEAMRYTPPHMMASSVDEAPVYENIQFYTSPKKSLVGTSSANSVPRQTYQPVSSNLAALKTDAHFATQKPFEQSQFPPPSASMKCKSFSPSYPAPQIIKPSPQRFSQPTSSACPQTQHATSTTIGYEKSPQRVIKQGKASDSPPIHTSPAGSSPKMPLAALPSRKVFV